MADINRQLNSFVCKLMFAKCGAFEFSNGNIYTYVISCFISPSSKFGLKKIAALNLYRYRNRSSPNAHFKSNQIVTTKSSTLLTQHVTICPLGVRSVCMCVSVCAVASYVVIVYQITSVNEKSLYLTER